MEPVQGRIRFAMALATAGGLAGLVGLLFTAFAIGKAIGGETSATWPLMAGALGCVVASYVLRLAAFDQSHHAAFRLERILRMRMAERLARVPLGVIEQAGTGTLVKVLHDDVKDLHVFVADSTPLHARAYATPLAAFVLLAWLDWRLALGAGAVLVFGFTVLGLAMRNHVELARRYNAARETVSARVVEYVQAMPVVRSFNAGHATFGRYQQALDAYLEVLVSWYRASSFTARFSMAILNPLPTLVMLLTLGVVLYRRDALELPSLLAALVLGTSMAESILPLMMLRQMVEKAKLGIERINHVLGLPVLPVPAPDASSLPGDASVVFEHVRFGYGTGEADAVDDVSFIAAPGTVTALVGPSGAGKTTVARLVARFWDVTSGRILVGGADVRDIHPDVLMRHVAMVFQDTFLFTGSIADNIALGTVAGREAVIAAARTAQAHDFIAALPAGYDTPAGERGLFLSGGQRQRIAIARAIVQDRPILILDEATAFADPENEAALVAALSALMRERTVIVVAHRLATIQNAHQILVLERGRVAERGDHETLVTEGGTYARLWAHQAQAAQWTLGISRAPCSSADGETA
ncbi:ABC transporter ATP-binding protein [Xanthobacteraceae bacterium A53D]